MQCILCQLARPLTGQVGGQPPTPVAIALPSPDAAAAAVPRFYQPGLLDLVRAHAVRFGSMKLQESI